MSTPVDGDDYDALVFITTEGEVARELLLATQAAQEEIDAVPLERRPSDEPRELERRNDDDR